MIVSAVMLDARVTVAEAAIALESFPDAVWVAIRRPVGMDLYWYAFKIEDLRVTWDVWTPDTPLDVALNLHETDAVEVHDSLAAVPENPTQIGVLADGDLVAVVVPERQAATRSLRPGGDMPMSAPPPSAGAGPPETGAEPPVARNGGTGPFSAYPAVEAPEQVHPGSRFDLTVGLAPEAAPGTAGSAMTLTDVDETFDLVVQISAQGFGAPEGIRRFLHVRRDQPETSSVAVALVAPNQDEPSRHVIEVEYSHEGVLIGRAWREVIVTAVPVADVEVRSDGAAMTTPPPGTATDLTVTVIEGATPGSMMWTFISPHDIELPDHQVETRVPSVNAQAFAYSQIIRIGDVDGSSLLPNLLTGIGRDVAAAAPVEFWEVVDRAWRAADGVPTLLFVSSDPYVPWELASTEDDYVAPELTDDGLPATLGAQLRMGRWIPPGPRSPRGMQRPAMPPPRRVDIDTMALVVGDYLAERGQRPLPHAIKEGKELARRYPTIWRSATLEQVDELFDDRLRERGEPVHVQAVHIACHGEVDGANPQHNGIVLSDDNRRLTSLMIRGSTLGRSSQPFVFVNACQVGQADQGLGDYGGLAGAFLKEGARGFIAPLWSVNDVIAHDTALEFYRLTVDDGVTVGAAMQQIRARYDTTADTPASTPLAYAFYGHPDLTLALEDKEN